MSYRLKIAICFYTILTGCALGSSSRVANLGASSKLAHRKQADSIHVTYRTNSDRLNVASASSVNTLPNVTVSQLHLQYPHPSGNPDLARATLIIAPDQPESHWFTYRRKTGTTNDQVLDQRTLDLSATNIHAIVGKLQHDKFFRRSKPLVSKSRLGVVIDGIRFEKDYGSVTELDALILKVYQQGHASRFVSHHAKTNPVAVLRRLPATNRSLKR